MIKKFFLWMMVFLFMVFGIMGMLSGNSLIMNSVRNENHANSKHINAPVIRQSYQDGVCEGTEMWFSPSRGTILILCGIPSSNQWGGLIFRVTENNGEKWLGDNAYECSVFASNRGYWTKVIERDNYFPMVMYPDIERMFKGWYQ